MRRTLATALVVSLLALTGCTSHEDPPAAAGSSPTAASSPTPSGPVEPTMPAVARHRTTPGAKALVGYYFEQVTFAEASGDTSGLDALQSAACIRCTNGASWIERVYRRGGKIIGGAHHVLTAAAFAVPGQPDLYVVNARVHGASSQVVHAGSLNRRYPSDTFGVRFVLGWDKGWLISSWADQ